MSLIAPTLQAFFTERLITQRNTSPQTIASYRDTLRLLLRFAHRQTRKQPCELDFDDLDAPLIGAFLDHLERERHNTARTRNNRLAAIHSFYRYGALIHPEHAATIGRVLAIPTKRYERKTISYLDRTEIGALLRAPDRSTWLGRRDHALFRTEFSVCPFTAWLYGRCVHLPSSEFGVTQKRRTKSTKEMALRRRGGRCTVSPTPGGMPR